MDSSNGPFGQGSGAGCSLQARLLRSTVAAEPADCHYMPHPRGALENLRLVPMAKTLPGPGEVKVCLKTLWMRGCSAALRCLLDLETSL